MCRSEKKREKRNKRKRKKVKEMERKKNSSLFAFGGCLELAMEGMMLTVSACAFFSSGGVLKFRSWVPFLAMIQGFSICRRFDVSDISFELLQNDVHSKMMQDEMMQDELVGGGKVYLVYPVIEESEQLPQLRAATAEVKTISEKFKNYQCGLLHGRMKSEEKDEALKKFRSGGTQILLATQVIEIGVDVPDASMMVVMNAERYGIAQLHQLRGRVGCGERKSKCVFLSSTSGTLDRLKVLEKSSDAFYLANADLLLRGPGNLLGKKQSGHLPEFPIARLEIDGNILQEAHLAALKVLAASNDLDKFPRLKAELSMRQPLCLLGD